MKIKMNPTEEAPGSFPWSADESVYRAALILVLLIVFIVVTSVKMGTRTSSKKHAC